MPPTDLRSGALVLYKSQPARILQATDKIEIELLFQSTRKKVRPKDVIPLHPGPVTGLETITATPADLDEARELLSGEETSLTELAELIFNSNTPSALWSAWKVVSEGLHFHGSPHRVRARTTREYEQERERRENRKARRENWQAFVERVAQRAVIESDREFLLEVEKLALNQGSESRLLQHLGKQQSRENAHALLLDLGYWDKYFNPHPLRLDFRLETVAEKAPDVPLETFASTGHNEKRLDLTGLRTFAIDDEGSLDPDDAISFDGEKLWIHIADVAGLVPADSPLDRQAREQAATLYLPEGTRTMLPREITDRLGLGLNEISPALSFAVTLGERGEILDLEIHPSLTRVTRLSYREAESLLDKDPDLREISRLTTEHRQRRLAAGAVTINLPECRIRVNGKEIDIARLPSYRSREIVSEAMLIAGSASARYAVEHQLPMPFAGQAPPTEMPDCEGLDPLAAMFALRRCMRPGRITTSPQPHAGLGLDAYIRITSPLRRYLDLLAHQQLRLHLAGLPPLPGKEILNAIAAVTPTVNRIRQAERLSNRHWTLAWLQEHPEWRGQGTVVAEWGRKSLLAIPELALECELNRPGNPPPGTHLSLRAPRVNLPWLEVVFRTD